jgi:hypothetical protein
MKKIIWSLVFCSNLSSFAMWVEIPNPSNGGHPDFVNSNQKQVIQSITIQNDQGSKCFDVM